MTPPIGQRIRIIRNAQRITMRQLATRIGREEWVIRYIERGLTWADGPRLEAICAALGVTVGEIQSPHWRTLCARGGVGLEEAL